MEKECDQDSELDPNKEFPQLFQEGMGKLNGFQARLSLSSDANPVFHKSRPVPFAYKRKWMRRSINDVLKPVEQSE